MVDTKNFYKECLRADHGRSICLQYPINYYILNMGVSKSTRKEDCKIDEPEWHSYLSTAFDEIVVPMNLEIR